MTTRPHLMTNHARSDRQLFSSSRSTFRPAALLGALGLAAAALLATPARPARALSWQVPQPGGLVVMERTLLQDQGAWVVNYRLKYQGNSGIVVTPTEILARLEGWVSNSRVAAHTTPRLSSVVVSGASGLSGAGEVVSAADESLRCREKVTLQVWTDDPTAEGEDSPAPPAATSNTNPNSGARNGAAERQPILSLAPGASVRVRMRLDHLHYLYGDYDPLLGVRSLELTLGAATMRDVLPLDVEQYLAQPKYSWPAPPEDRRDDKFFLSAPDSLHLEAHVTGNQYYRFPERPVRYGTLMRLRFAYFIAAGTEGECRVQVAQYKDTPTSWKALSDGMYSQCLNKVGRWVRVERVFRTEPEANLLALDFKISSIEEVGEMWIDDVSLEPVAPAPPARP